MTAPPTPPQPAAAPPDATPAPDRPTRRRGNPNLAPRCGAKARTTGCPCQAPAMANGRCRMHGGKSTGPRTAGRHRPHGHRQHHARQTRRPGAPKRASSATSAP